MPSNRKIYFTLYCLLAISALIRAFIAGSIELGNDEVYYWTYARFPDLSHFDHPPMVGLVIQLFTLNLTFDSEFFLRLASVVLGTGSTWLIFLTGKTVKNELTGLYAAFLFTGSFYCFILSGTFIMPDTPQVFFWLLSLWLLLTGLPDREKSKRGRNSVFYAGVAIGLAFLSKYHSLFLLFGGGLFILIFNRGWFKTKELYMTLFFFILLTLPVVFWNMDNEFISFTFHENRVGITESGFQPQYLATELAGQFFYNNPVNVAVILISLISLFGKSSFLDRKYTTLLLLISLPLILLFTGFSFFRSTLPHWSGPGYLGLMVIAAAWLSEKGKKRNLRLFPVSVIASLALMLSVIVIAVGQIKTGMIPVSKMGGDDITHDLTGWKQLGEKFQAVNKREVGEGHIAPGAPILTFRWFPAANFDYYAGRKIHKPVYATGNLERIHKYYWINKIRGKLPLGSDAWYLGLSDDYEDPFALYSQYYTMIIPADTLIISRGNEEVRKVFLYKMLGLKKNFPEPEDIRNIN